MDFNELLCFLTSNPLILTYFVTNQFKIIVSGGIMQDLLQYAIKSMDTLVNQIHRQLV